MDVLSDCLDIGLSPIKTHEVSEICIELGKWAGEVDNNLYDYFTKRQTTLARNFQSRVIF